MTPDNLIPFIIGPSAGLVISCVANWYQAKEKAAKDAIIAKKDEDAKAITREAIGAITTLAGLNQANQRWQDQTTAVLKEIRDHQNQ